MLQMEVDSSVKKEQAVGVKVKRERNDEREGSVESPQKESMEMDDLLLQLKLEINEEMEQQMRLSSVDTGDMHGVRIKEEFADKSHQDFHHFQSQFLNSEADKVMERALQSSNTAQGQRIVQPGNAQVAKRRRLTRRDWPDNLQREVASSVKKEPAVGLKIKKERIEQEGSMESPQNESIQMDDLWLQIRKEINKQYSSESTSPSCSAGAAMKTLVGDSVAPQTVPEPSSCDIEEPAKSDDQEEISQDSGSAERSSMDAFASQAATWVKQCLAFRSSQTWSPTRPCCPANFFLGSRNGNPSSPPTDAPACVLRLDGHRLRCLQRFHEKHSQGATGCKSEEDASHGPQLRGFPLDSFESDSNLEECKVRGLDCMKMWPWMRDLPTGVWGGRGWAFDENGLRRLSSTGGSAAMQGVELFEAVGTAEVKTKETAVAGPAAETAAPAEGQKASRFKRNNLVKQSGVPNVRWDKTLVAWKVDIPSRIASKGKRIGRTNRVFAVKKFLVPGRSEAQADAAALEAANAFRAELVQQGVLTEPKPRDPNFTSEVPGVRWKKREQKWQVEIPQKGGKKSIFGGCFTEKAAAEAKALELREQHGLERQVMAVSTLTNRYAGLPVFSPKVPYPRVNWSQAQQQWHACCRVDGATRSFRIKPRDHSEEELERSFKVAVAWRKKQEKEKEKAPKAKAPPVKKQRK